MKSGNLLALVAAWAVCQTFNPQLGTARAQGTAFRYQGQLNDSGAAANGTYDLMFTLYGSSSGGSAVAGPETSSAAGVSNGLFTVTIDFGLGTKDERLYKTGRPGHPESAGGVIFISPVNKEKDE